MSPGSSTKSYPAFARIELRENSGENLNQETCPDRDSNPGHLNSNNNTTDIITYDELIEVYKRLKNGKAPGEDNLNFELFKYAGVINAIFKSSHVQKHTRLKVYKTLARPVLTYGSEAWTIRKADEQRLTTAEMRFMRRTAGCSLLEHRKNVDILQELKMDPIVNFVQQYRLQWKKHVERMDRSRWPKQILTYVPRGKRKLGRPRKRWHETVTDPFNFEVSVPNSVAKMENIEIRTVIKYFVRKGMSPTKIKADKDATLGESAPAFSAVKKWAALFKHGRECVESMYNEGIASLQHRWIKSVNLRVDYVEK
ncbi:hypothetical protein ANN_24674 [Periplaneta americana]|uniref:Uncharacterized protein n=1 Tax=Periplaneta americana TaxID=6978 RepID=A0ABQ8S423_PERAM|nr:hypothetical protein ANN_24674 [Periplaneta americana]